LTSTPPPPPPPSPDAALQGHDDVTLQQLTDKAHQEQAMGSHPLACAVVLALVATLAFMHQALLLLMVNGAALDTAATQSASIYSTGISIAAIIVSGFVCDRCFKQCTSYNLT
jgi:hypothetical protein